ncbi:apoptosis-linked 2-interacting protein X 1 [Loa loa]|uniref:Apoptosis-linked 2-interacting protein X 1 n=1 Tax=Loa loa TaxID=7209 RepID=A0A1S0UH34_LOALO|nr:apoptosis-linked 2-interacting protein X 1 [Loa loa]EJD74895.1 apoptosis-linked 2-interacting protein X 1 [Loa loa]
MSSFLAVPLKHTNEVDLVKPLMSYVENIYQSSSELSSEIREAMQELNKMRNKACNQPLDKHQSALDVLTRYYDQLVAIENKIPITATQNPINFKWKDAFDKGSLFFGRASLTLSDGAFERAAVLFNCGALMSAIAASQPMRTDEELKTAAKFFQQSAGIFAHLKDTILGIVQQEPTPDLMPDTLSVLSAIMLAQAQEAIYIKAEKDKMKPLALIKLAAQCAENYHEAQKQLQKDVVRGLFDKEWTNTLKGKAFGLSALAQYHKAVDNADSKNIGEQLSRLTESQSLMQQAVSCMPHGTFDVQYAAIQKAYASAKKDNDFIYHERVADFRSLPHLPKAAVAKITPVTFPMTPRFKDMFSNLVPVQVHQATASFDARKSEVINVETGRLREHTQIMNGILASLNLPAALDDVTNHEILPESIRQKSSKVKSLGGIDALTSLIADLPNIHKRNKEILDETLRLLNEEKGNDDRLRSQFKDKWTRMASDHLTAPLHQECGKYRGILHAASNADETVKQKLEENREGIKNMYWHYDLVITYITRNIQYDFTAAIPCLDSASANKNSEAVVKLRSLMDVVQEIKIGREKLEKEFTNVRCDMSPIFLKALTDNQIINEEEISTAKIAEIYGPLKTKVNESIKKQEDCLALVEVWNKKFGSEKASSQGAVERERILKILANGHDKFLEIKSNLDEGTKFYNDLTPLLLRLQQKVSDFCFARQTEKEDLMKQLQQNIVSGSSCGSAPPRPPPPKTSSNASVSNNPFDAEAPIPPPRNINNFQATQASPIPPQNPNYQPQLCNSQQQQPFASYAQAPYGYPVQQTPYLPQPQFNQNYTTPYPVAYPGTYPGAFNPPLHAYSHFPSSTMSPQWGNVPSSTPQ